MNGGAEVVDADLPPVVIKWNPYEKKPKVKFGFECNNMLDLVQALVINGVIYVRMPDPPFGFIDWPSYQLLR